MNELTVVASGVSNCRSGSVFINAWNPAWSKQTKLFRKEVSSTKILCRCEPLVVACRIRGSRAYNKSS